MRLVGPLRCQVARSLSKDNKKGRSDAFLLCDVPDNGLLKNVTSILQFFFRNGTDRAKKTNIQQILNVR